MARWYAILAFIFIVQTSFGQNSRYLALEITEIIRSGNPRISIGHVISDHWSIEARSSFHFSPVKPDQAGTAATKSTMMELSLRHWRYGCYKYMYLSLGVLTGFRKETDMKLGLGYSVPVWKNIGLDIGYGFRVIEAINNGSGEITIELFYTF